MNFLKKILLPAIIKSRSKPSRDLLNSSLDLIEHLNQVIFQIDVAGSWIFLNGTWVTFTGFSLEESLGKNFLEFVHPNDRDLCNQNIISLIKKEKEHFHIKVRFISKEENFFWASLHANKFDETTPVIVGSLTDISDEVREAGEFEATHRSLSSLVDNLSGLIYRGRNDHDWTMEYVSSGCYKLTGYKPEDLINKSVTFASLIHPEDRENVWNEVQLALNDRTPFELIYQITTIKGEEKWIWERGQGNYSSNGELLSLEGHMTNITSWKKDYLQSLNDTLYVGNTDLTHRHLFMDRLMLAVTRSSELNDFNFALLMVQADRINKLLMNFSEESRNKVRIQMQQTLSDIMRPLDTICMIKDDKFAILIENISSLDEITNFTEKIHNSLSTSIILENSNLFITVSVGIATSSPQYSDHNHVIRDANTALIRAKVLGGGCDEIFDEKLNLKVSLLSRFEADINNAISNDEINLLYQPIVSSESDLISGVETILVWEHPRRGTIYLKDYLSVVNEKRISDKINNHILDILDKQIINSDALTYFEPDFFIIFDFFNSYYLHETFIKRLDRLMLKNLSSRVRYYLYLTDEENQSLTKKQSDLLQDLCSKNNFSKCVELQGPGMLFDNELKNTNTDMIMIKNPDSPVSHDHYHMIKSKINFVHSHNIPVIICNIYPDTNIDSIRKLNPNYLQGSNICKPVNFSTIETILHTPKWPWEELSTQR